MVVIEVCGRIRRMHSLEDGMLVQLWIQDESLLAPQSYIVFSPEAFQTFDGAPTVSPHKHGGFYKGKCRVQRYTSIGVPVCSEFLEPQYGS